ncbi:MAG: hypothetical protein AB2821_15010 [Candidatus Thiodiazotropha endolucinida]
MNPEQIILRVDSASFDIGSFCYATRNFSHIGGRNKSQREVALESLLPHRPSEVLKVIHYLSSLIVDKGLRNDTVTTVFKFFTAYMNWADDNGYFGCLTDDDNLRAILEAWFDECEDRFKRGVWGGSHTWANQSGMAILLSNISTQRDLKKGLRFVKFRSSNTGTDPAPEGDFALALAINEALFTGLSNLVLDNHPYPFKLAMPKLPDWRKNYLWLFPTHRWYLPPHFQGQARSELPNPLWSFDFINGRIAEFDEIQQHYQMPCLARNSICKAEQAIERANIDDRNAYRRQAAITAHDSFLFLFMAHTGLNEAVIRELRWEGEILAEAKQQGFRELKWRASGKVVSALVRAKFLPMLRRFLELRSYLLRDVDTDCDWLFISITKSLLDPSQIRKGMLQKHYARLARIYPKVPNISGRKLRATMHEWYHRNVDPTLTARITGHTQETIDKHYQAGTVGAHREEVSSFLDKVADRAHTLKRILPVGEHLDSSLKGPLGECEKQKGPSPIANDSPIKPNCKEVEGCLFCKRHAVKADEEDVRKLASCAYVIEQTFYFPGSENHFRPTLTLIDEYLADIKDLLGSSNMVDNVTSDVYKNGNLDSYWAEKLALLDSIGIVV